MLTAIHGVARMLLSRSGSVRRFHATVPLPPPQGYRLCRWPQLPEGARAGELRALSVMSQRPVTVAWFARQVGWTSDASEQYLEVLVRRGDAVRVVSGQR